MTDLEFYELSNDTNAVFLKAKKLLGLQLLRYKHLVDGSDKRFDCTYARMTRRHFVEGQQSELSTLLDLSEALTSLITKLEETDVKNNTAQDSF